MKKFDNVAIKFNFWGEKTLHISQNVLRTYFFQNMKYSGKW